ncbi:GyrI-like domain-containing protein [Pedobacter nyackensis]|uniref:GyrI-like domain-containing protein n=1 Tax=Pedobacter nyackensis TaxID=475255 RepID=UPI00292E38C7|nr:GyrI-like domain-containing protein [Pedobacter nyackensis]
MNSLKIEPFKVIGISVRTTNENGQAGTDISNLWARFMQEKIMEAIPNKIDNTVYSIYTDYEKDHTRPYTTILGCKVESLNDIPDGMTGKSFDGGNYVKLSAKGDLMEGLIINKWIEIWGMDLDRAFTADLEVFGEKAQNPANAEIDFLIAVK